MKSSCLLYSNIIVNFEITKDLILSEQKEGCLLSPHSFSVVLEILACAESQEIGLK